MVDGPTGAGDEPGRSGQTLHTSPRPRVESRCSGDFFPILVAIAETETDLRRSLQIPCRCGGILVQVLEYWTAAILRVSARTSATPPPAAPAVDVCEVVVTQGNCGHFCGHLYNCVNPMKSVESVGSLPSAAVAARRSTLDCVGCHAQGAQQPDAHPTPAIPGPAAPA
jgi:hypothetical protein